MSSGPNRHALERSEGTIRPYAASCQSPEGSGLQPPQAAGAVHVLGKETLHLTANFVDEMRGEELRRLRTETIASTLLRYTRTRKPNVIPQYLSPATEIGSDTAGSAANPPAVVIPKTTSLDTYKPTTGPLPSPALGIAAGMPIVTAAHTHALPLTKAQQMAVVSRERSANEKYFAWWEERVAVRARHKFRDDLERTLEVPLGNSARNVISEEEDQWMKDLCPGYVGGGQVRVNPNLQSYSTSSARQKRAAAGADIMAQSNQLTPSRATSRGIVVPLHSMEAFFRRLRAVLHERSTSLLVTYHERHAAEMDSTGEQTAGLIREQDSASEGSVASNQETKVRLAEEMYLTRLIETEQELSNDAAKHQSMTPSCVSLPPDRILLPLLSIETSTAVALMWKVLEQVRMVVPGMEFALSLYRNYLLPHIFENFAAFDNVLPQVGSLSEQVGFLNNIPLRAQVSILVTDSSLQSHDDLRYMEAILKHWALRTWRKAVLAQRRLKAKAASFTGLLQRVKRKSMLRAVFDAWRLEARDSATAHYMHTVDLEYRKFLGESTLHAQVTCLPKSLNDNADSIHFNRSHYLATKLAETAQHVKKGTVTTSTALRAVTAASSHTEQTPLVGLPSVVPSNPISSAPDPPQPPQSQPTPHLRLSVFPSSSTVNTPRHWMTPGTELLSERTIAVSPPSAKHLCHATPPSAHVHSSMGVPPRRPVVPVFLTSTSAAANKGQCLPSESLRSVSIVGSVASGLKARRASSGGRARPALSVATGGGGNPVAGTFEEMLSMLKVTEEVCNHLRSEIGVQKSMIQKLEAEKRGLLARNRELEDGVLQTVKEKLHYCNVVQEKHLALQERDRRIAQLKSRLRAHRNRPWQRVVMRVMGELCGSSTQRAELADELRIQGDLRTGDRGSANKEETASPAHAHESVGSDDDIKDSVPEVKSQADREAEEERLFGELAPIVLSSAHAMPDALVILQDWANGCLNDLQSLDDLKGGALSVRFASFSEEARSGVLISRLLFYLALPRYLHRTAGGEHADQPLTGAFSTDFPDRRRQLLEQRNVQLDSPFPIYADCFGDLLDLRPGERMILLLQFATELVTGVPAPPSDAFAMKQKAVEDAVFSALDISPPISTSHIELQEIIDPHALAMGERASVVTLIALLYTRFAHPFNHKCRQSAEVERAAMLYLLSGGKVTAARPSTIVLPDVSSLQEGIRRTSTARQTLEEEILAQLDDEDKSPWQLFKERCLPVFGTEAHPFLLRGNFWPSDAFDSPHLAGLLGELGMALNRSLQIHRWHVTLSCLVPVMTYSGLSRGFFTGPRASPAALQVGLESEGAWEFPLHGASLQRVYKRRGEVVQQWLRSGLLSPTAGGAPGLFPPPSVASSSDDSPPPEPQLLAWEKSRLMQSLHTFSEDLLSLFLTHSVLSAELALPTLSLSGWRLLCADMGVVSLQLGEESNAPLELEHVTITFSEAVASLNESLVQTLEPSTIGSEDKRQDRSRSTIIEHLGDKQLPFSRAPAEDIKGPGAVISDSPVFSALDTSPASHRIASYGLVPLPSTARRMDMTYTAFALAMVLLADLIFPVRPPPDPPQLSSDVKSTPSPAVNGRQAKLLARGSPVWLADALARFMDTYALRSDKCLLRQEPQMVLKRLQMGSHTQEVITLYTPAIIVVYNAYSKDIYGSAGMEKEDLLQLLRDAMLTSTEISQHLIYEVFHYCCVTRRAVEEEASAVRRELDGRPRVGGGLQRRRVPRAVSIVDPHTHAVSSNRRREAQVLVIEGFTQFLCVLCHFKQPNPLIPLHQRLEGFLRRSLLRPLCPKIESLGPLLNRVRHLRESVGEGWETSAERRLSATTAK